MNETSTHVMRYRLKNEKKRKEKNELKRAVQFDHKLVSKVASWNTARQMMSVVAWESMREWPLVSGHCDEDLRLAKRIIRSYEITLDSKSSFLSYFLSCCSSRLRVRGSTIRLPRSRRYRHGLFNHTRVLFILSHKEEVFFEKSYFERGRHRFYHSLDD